MSCRSAAQIRTSEFSRGCSAHVSNASVPTATVCSSSPPRYAWCPARVHGARPHSARRAPSPSSRSSSTRYCGSWTSRARCSRKPSSSSTSRYATGRKAAGSASWARSIVRTSTCSSSRKRSTRPRTRTRSPRSKRPASRSASRNARAWIAPVRSRSSNARYGDPERASRRSLRAQANSSSTSSPGRSVATLMARYWTGGRTPRGTVGRVQPLRWERRPDGLRAPALVCAFKGWNDAGESASSALTFMGAALEATRFATIDPEDFLDFQATRPTVKLVDGLSRKIEWPEWEIFEARVPRAPRDLVILTGPEPSMRWPTFTRTVIELAEALGAQLVVQLGALLADVPHTRPVHVTGQASDVGLIERMDLQPPTYEGPTGIVGVLHAACADAGMPSASLWAAVPHYVAVVPNPKGALALLRRLETLVG